MSEQSVRAASCHRAAIAGGCRDVGLAILIVLAGVYGMEHLRSNPPRGLPSRRSRTAARLAPLAHGEVAALAAAHTPFRVPDLELQGRRRPRETLTDWRGRTVLLNLWATWCVPCRKEMPALDTLQADLGGQGFEVIAVNIDTRDAEKPLNFSKTPASSTSPIIPIRAPRCFRI